MPELSDHDMITNIYTELMGLDGSGGMIQEHKEMKQDVDMLKQGCVSEKTCEDNRKHTAFHRRNVWRGVRDVVLLGGIIFTFLWGNGVFK